MFVKIPGVRIAGIRAAVPSQEIAIEDELEYYGNSLKKVARVKKMIGTDKRRLAWPGQTASDLCFAAAKNLLNAFPDKRGEIDALVFITQSPDYDFPATACILQDRLGLPQGCAAFDVNQGCSGFVYGLWLAASMIAGGCRNALIMAGDVPYKPRDPKNRVIASIFGDGGGAALVSADSSASPLYFSIGTDGSGYEHIIMPAGRGRLPFHKKHEDNRIFFEDVTSPDGVPWRLDETYMDGGAVFSFTMRVVPDHIRDFLQKTNTPVEGVDYFVFHQANRQIITEIAKKAGIPVEKAWSGTFSRYGNLSSASIPASLWDIFGSARSTGDCQILLSGYGVGLSWASCLWHAHDCGCAPVLDVEAPEKAQADIPAKIEYWRNKMQKEQK